MATRRACRTKKFAWNTRRISRSPFGTRVRARNVERNYKKGKSVGFTALSSLKSQGRIPRSTGCYELGAKYA
jgi:hypothetical protein